MVYKESLDGLTWKDGVCGKMVYVSLQVQVSTVTDERNGATGKRGA